jgi:TolA-binding protein
MRSSKPPYLIFVLALAGTAPSPHASEQCPVSPGHPGWLEQQMVRREDAVSVERLQAIRLLQEFLKEYPDAAERADALFRLSELFWENSENDFLSHMRAYDQALEDFRMGKLKDKPEQPHLDLTNSLKVYEEILEKHPDFQRTDTVMYLYGFGLNEQGDEQAALSIYRVLLKRFPKSSFVPDAYLAIGEYHFAKGHYPAAKDSYEKVLQHPNSPLLDLALYKTAWCYFKEGNAQEAARRFRRVLRRSKEQQSEGKRGRVEATASELEKEALEDLALTFSESGGAQEAYRFMKQVGGQEYSIRVLRQLGEVFFRQARYDEAIDSFRMLVDQFPLARRNPEHHARIADAYQREGKLEEALEEHRALASRYGPGSSWARENASHGAAIEEANRLSEISLRFVATYRHKQAQEKKTRQAYLESSRAYQEYLKLFAEHPRAPKIHFYLGEVLYKLERFEQAAYHYGQAAGKAKDARTKKEASYAAILSFDHLRKKKGEQREPPAKEQPLEKAEQGFVQAVDEYSRIAPDDKRLPQLRFEVGKTFYYRGQYTRAAQQFLGVVQNHPQDEFAEPAADLALDCYSRKEDWPSLEKKAKNFLRQGTFKGKELGGKLMGFATAAIFQNAAKLNKQKDYSRAAGEYQRLVEEFPRDPRAPKALFNAAVCLENAGEKQKAVATYERIMQRYPDRAADATFVIAGIYERQYDYEKAARHYGDFAEKFRGDERAPAALLQAALLHRAQRSFDKEAAVLQAFTHRYPRHEQAGSALFQAGQALERAGKIKQAERIFADYLKKHASRQQQVREATLHLAQALLQLGRRSKARSHFERCGAFPARKPPTGTELASAAHCRFMLAEMVFDEYKKIKLRPPKKRLVKLLKEKAQMLKNAEGLFTDVVAAGHMEWASAALFRIGDMYAKFAQAIYQAPMPKGLSQQELDVYRQELQSLAYPIEDKALSAFSISFEMAKKHGYFSRWSEKTVQELRRLDPGKYPKEEEVRPRTRWADSFTTYPLILKPLPLPAPKALGGKP